MRTRLAITAALAASLLLSPIGGTARAGHESSPYFDLDKLPATDFNGDQIFESLKSFVAAYPYRVTGGPTEILAGQFLANQTAALGYETSIYTLGPNEPVRT